MEANTQKPERYAGGDGHTLDVHSIFPTIQGEGPFAGRPATFVRLAGCNLKCPWCDTDYTAGRRLMSVDKILDTVVTYGNKLVVITGGEPFRQPLEELVRRLGNRDPLEIQIETNGAMLIPDTVFHFATVVCSPKTAQIPLINATRIKCWKYVVSAGAVDNETGLPTNVLGRDNVFNVLRTLGRSHIAGATIYIQPMDAQDEDVNRSNTQAAIESCQKHGHTLCLQLHKFVNLP